MTDTRSMACVLAFPFTALILLATPSAVAAQHEHGDKQMSTSTMQLAVDGSRSPQRISDDLAYRHFIVAAAIRDDSADQDRERRDAFIRRIGLSQSDEALLRAALGSVSERLAGVSVRKESIRRDAPATTRASIRQQEEAVFDGANKRIRSLLSKEGFLRLDRFVRKEVKPGIKVYTDTSR